MKFGKTSTVESLLGVLSLEPMSGYEMRQMMEHSTANFWSESFGQIYPALKKMLAEGLVEVVEDRNAEGHPAKKVYRITDAGLERLRGWLRVPAKPQVYRHELLLKIFFGDRAAPGVITAQVHAWQQRFAADLARYEATQHKLQTEYATHPAMPYWRMTVRYGIAEAKTILAWCAETIAELEELEAGTRRK